MTPEMIEALVRASESGDTELLTAISRRLRDLLDMHRALEAGCPDTLPEDWT